MRATLIFAIIGNAKGVLETTKYGCTSVNMLLIGDEVEQHLNVDTRVECQNECAGTCTGYSFDVQAQTCYTTTTTQPRMKKREGAITVMATCDKCPSTNATGAFPGTDAKTTGSAFEGSKQPMPLMCWPKEIKDDTVTLGDCAYDITVLQTTAEDAQAGDWRGGCQGLAEQKGVTSEEECRSTCYSDVGCATWQWVPSGVESGAGSGCFTGVGYKCQQRQRQGGWSNVSSERIQRGIVRVLAKMNKNGQQLDGLVQVFDGEVYDNATIGAQHCATNCYAALTCTLWQYYPKTGCWIEYPAGFEDDGGKKEYRGLPYPLFYSNGVLDKASVQVTDGEFIQHYCEPTTTTTTLFNFAPFNLNVGDQVVIPQNTQVCVTRTAAGADAVEVGPSSGPFDNGPSDGPSDDSDEPSRFSWDDVCTTSFMADNALPLATRRLAEPPTQAIMPQQAEGTISKLLAHSGLYVVDLNNGQQVLVRPENVRVWHSEKKAVLVSPTEVVTPAPADNTGLYVAIVVVVCGIIVGCIVAYFFCQERKPKEKKTRGRKKNLPEEPEAPAETPKQVAAPMMPAMTYAAPPVVTYAAAPHVATHVVPVHSVVQHPAMVQYAAPAVIPQIVSPQVAYSAPPAASVILPSPHAYAAPPAVATYAAPPAVATYAAPPAMATYAAPTYAAHLGGSAIVQTPIATEPIAGAL